MPVFRVLASRTELHLIEAYVRASNMEDAEARFYGALETEEEALSWHQDFDSSETEIDSIEPCPPDHDAVPSGENRFLCLYCGRPARWTGTAAKDSPTGSTIAGPWIHVDQPIAAEGLGL
jgi:hypothetical protein